MPFPTPQLGVLSRYLTRFPDGSVDAYWTVIMTAGPNPPEVYAPIPGAAITAIATANGHTSPTPSDICQAISTGISPTYAGLSIVPAMATPSIASVAPSPITGSGTPQTLTITGAGFTAQSTVVLNPATGSPLTPTVTFVSNVTLTVTVNVVTGIYSLVVSNLDNQSASTNLTVS